MVSGTIRSRKPSTGKENEKASNDDVGDIKPSTNAKSLKNEPLPSFPNQRVWTRLVVILCTLIVVYFTSSQDKVVNLAKVKDKLSNRRQEMECSSSYREDVTKFPGCAPATCGRAVMDYILTQDEATRMLNFAQRVVSLASPDTTETIAATVVDLTTGAVFSGSGGGSLKVKSVLGAPGAGEAFSRDHKILISKVRRKIREAVAMGFSIDADKLNFTSPSLVLRLTSANPVTELEEYWHSYSDKDKYKSFHYSSIVFLNAFDADFKGGRFIFDDPEHVSTVLEPKAGRVLTYTSGQENVRRIERLLSGELFALVLPLTCDPSKAIDETVK